MSLKDVGVESGNGVAVVVCGGGTVVKGKRKRRHDFDFPIGSVEKSLKFWG